MNAISTQSSLVAANKHWELICPKLKKPTTTCIYYATSPAGKLFSKLNDNTITAQEKNVLQYLYGEIDNLIRGDVSRLSNIISRMGTLLEQNNLEGPNYGGIINNPVLHSHLVECFNYDSYSTGDKPYEILSDMGFESCPYCNRQYITTYKTPAGRTRATLDHFFSQTDYPYLALSFFNLVPSCYSCNSSLKKTTRFLPHTHVHPYVESFDSHAKFTINFRKANDTQDYVAQFYQDKQFLEIDFVAMDGTPLANTSKAQGNINTFQLKGLYNLHKDLVVEILQKQAIYNQGGHAKSLAQAFPKLFNNEHDVLKLILGNYIQDDHLHKRPFSRMTRDICAEIGLTQEILRDLV